ncbi:type VI secretion system protein ImpL [Paraburkholderia silvatlantica]|uniref:Type VI secretion system protein ImpL n=1 Tax=Paraburkholderia silvatlantica TaxID=321895 RepID=A0A2V4U079_9BURK|nr:ImcF-related family protein [Paraburkholderia silvatlantica]PYE24304.1 type VI secretion system protein ImpL [Paraburkholderia silvatlantica]
MTIPKNNLQNMKPEAVASRPAPGHAAIWGMPLAALVLATAALLLVWFGNNRLGIPDGAPRTQLLIGIPIVLVIIVIAHLFAVSTGAYAGAARLFRFETGDQTKPPKPLKRDARLQRMYEELRVSHGWFWRGRLRWLLVNGTDERVDQVAPGLRQAGVMHVGETVLVHASPDGIEAAKWLGQLRQLRRRSPVDGVVHVARADDMDSELPRALSGIATALGWAAPVTFLHPVEAKGSPSERFDAVGAFMPNDSRRQAHEAAARLPDLLNEVEQRSADAGVHLCTGNNLRVTWLMEVSKYVGDHCGRIVDRLRTLAASNWLRAPLAGIMFAPVFPGPTVVPVPVANGDGTPGEPVDTPAAVTVVRVQPAALLPVWREIAAGSPNYRGRRVGFYWSNALATLVIAAAIAWCVWMTVSVIGNRQLVREADQTAQTAVEAKPQTAESWRAQLALQQLMEQLEYRRQHGAPWYLRAGLSRNDDILAALWHPYGIATTRNLQAPVVRTITDLLKAAGEARADALQSQDTRGSTYNALKTYLMLGDPARADATFLRRALVALWRRPVDMSEGERDDTGGRLAAFYADHLKAHPEWRITPDSSLVSTTRNMLVTQMGLASADDTVYQSILDEVKGKYADASLETLLNGADAHGLFTTSQTVPGIYTRAAWDGMIADAIDRAANERRVSGDWVLTGAQPSQTIGNTLAQGAIRTAAAIDEKRAAEELKQRLTARYFAEYTAAWQTMLNSLQWLAASNLNGAIDQLTRLADAQTSPLIALMKSVQYQAQAGRPSQALTDTLVRKAQSLIGNSDDANAPAVNPLDKSFGPLLALMGETGIAATNGANSKASAPANIALNGVSLSRYLTAVTTMRLKLQQIAGSPDSQAMARSLAQAVFQGKLSELSQARDDAALTAASLGAAWAGVGNAAFAQPLEAAWQTILQPAAASLNEAWRASVAAPFNAAMSGRYPFFDTQADASFAELGRFVRPDTGLIARFISTQLAGVLKLEGDHWTPNELAPQALLFDPKFLAGLRQLSIVGAQLYVKGDANERFEMMALPTPNVTRSELSVDGKQIVYFNQQESWTPLAWPGYDLNGHAGLTWQTLSAGLRQAFDSTGDWAFLRLLAKADVKQLDSTRYELTWNVANGDPLRYVLRTQVGTGPLELLKLRGFQMPERIFVIGKGGAAPMLPPLPPELMP